MCGSRRRGGDHPRRRRVHRHQRHRPLGAPHRRGVQASASPASWRCARTTTGRRRPASRPTCAPIAAATDLPVMVYDIPIRTGRKITTATLLRLAREVPNIVALKDAAGNPAETAAVIARCAGRLRGLQRRRRDDAAAAGRRRRRPRRRRHPLDGARPPGDVRPVGEGRHRRRPAGQQPGCSRASQFETGDEAPNPIPTKAMLRHLGHAGRPGAACRWAPTPACVDVRAPRCWPTCNDGEMRSPDRPRLDRADDARCPPMA